MNWTEFITTLGQSLSYPAFWVGFGLVALFAHSRFSASEPESNKEDPRVVSRSFTTRFRYALSAIAYIVFFESFFGLLVGIGSLPFLRDILADWIGGLKIPDNQDGEVGTPAWAALFVTAVLPSAPGFSTVDRAVRKALHNFASIPFKARNLARELLDNLKPEFLNSLHGDYAVDVAGENALAQHEAAQFAWLFDAIEKLKDNTMLGNKADDYKKFFEADYRDIWNGVQQKKVQMSNCMDASERIVACERKALLEITARFFCCALLSNEPSERNARGTIRDKLGVAHLPRLQFDFNLGQIVLSIVLAVILAFLGALVGLGYALPHGFADVNEKMIGTILFWLPFTAATMAVPFIFAAGTRLYVRDRYHTEDDIPFQDHLLVLISLFFFTYGVGIVPTLMGMVGGNYDLSKNWVMQIVPSGSTSAVVALLFYFLSSRHLVKSKWQAASLDILVFSAAAGFISWFTTYVAVCAGMDVEKMTRIEGLTNDVVLVVSPITHALMVGVIGAIQCYISRTKRIFQGKQQQLVEKRGSELLT